MQYLTLAQSQDSSISYSNHRYDVYYTSFVPPTPFSNQFNKVRKSLIDFFPLIYKLAFASPSSEIILCAPSAIIPLCLSSSINCCSSPKAKAYGTPSNKTLVARTQILFPPNVKVELAVENIDDDTLLIRARVLGGTISFKAAIRSYSVSSASPSRSDESEISESRSQQKEKRY